MAISEAPNRVRDAASTMFGHLGAITVEGVLDHEATSRCDADFARAMHKDTYRVALDLPRPQLTDAATISSILRGVDALRASSTDLEICYPPPMALQIFELCSLIGTVGVEFTLDPHRVKTLQKEMGRVE